MKRNSGYGVTFQMSVVEDTSLFDAFYEAGPWPAEWNARCSMEPSRRCMERKIRNVRIVTKDVGKTGMLIVSGNFRGGERCHAQNAL